MYTRYVKITDSSNIRAMYYDPHERKLLVIFLASDVSGYSYHDVEAEEFGKLVASPSVGKAINQLIKPNHKCSVVKLRAKGNE